MKETFIEKLTNKEIFIYIGILIIIIFICIKLNLSDNIIYGFLISSIIIYYLMTKENNNKNNTEDILNEKKKYIIPPLKTTLAHDEITNFLFSIQDFYNFNPQAYSEMITNLEKFFEVYKNTHNDKEKAYMNYSILIDCKNNTCIALESIIFAIPVNKDYEIKLSKSTKVLNNMLIKYLHEIYIINKENNYYTGMKSHSKLIDDPTLNLANPANSFEI